MLPPNVQAVTAKGKTYYYYQARRGTTEAGKRIALGSDARHPDFWAKIRELEGPAGGPKSIGAMILKFRGSVRKTRDGVTYEGASPEWRAYEPSTQRDYSFYLDKLLIDWAALAADGLRPSHVLALRDSMADSPGSANHMLAVGKTLYRWGIPRDFAKTNPFREVAPIKVVDDGHWPWPDWALDEIAAKAWPDLARFVFLAAQTGLRESDVVRLGSAAQEGKGFWVRPKKTRKTRKAFWVPLLSTALMALDQWSREPLIFTLERRKAPVAIAPGDYFVLSPAGNPYTPEGLRSRWNRWLRTDDGIAFATRWSGWEASRRERDGETVEDPASLKPTLHGLRATAVVIRRLAGYRDEQISNDIGMSLPMVRRYSRFIDQRHAAETNIVTLEEAQKTRSKKAR